MSYYRETTNRTTGTTIIVGHGDDVGLDAVTDGPWYTICDDHSLLCSHPTLALARSWAAGDGPLMWCEDCQAAQDERDWVAAQAAGRRCENCEDRPVIVHTDLGWFCDQVCADAWAALTPEARGWRLG